MVVMTPYTSLLVLENDEMYRTFKVDRGRKDHWAPYDCPAEIKVVYEPDPTQPVDVRNAPQGLKPAANTVLQKVLVRVPARFLGGRRQTLLTGVAVYSGAYGLAEDGDEGDARLGAKKLNKSLDGLRKIINNQERMRALAERGSVSRSETPLDHFAGRALRSKDDLAEIASPAEPEVLEKMVREAESAPLMLGDGGRDEAPVGFPAPAKPFPIGARAGLPPDSRTPFTPDGALLAGDTNGKLYLWNATNGRVEQAGFIRDGLSVTLGLGNAEPDPMSGDKKEAEGYFLARTMGDRSPSLLYGLPRFSEDAALFRDLLAYAPGLNTSWADIRAVLEDEAAPDLRAAPGSIAPAARRLIERSRAAAWRTLTLEGAKGEPPLLFHFDGAGRYAYERTLPLGLRERVVCDGTNLLHLYPDLGLASRRTVSRFHRAEVEALLPWTLPPAEDLARGLDLSAPDDRTVVLTPHSTQDANAEPQKKHEKSYRVHLIFADDGRLAERRLVEAPANKVVRSEVYDGRGGVRVLDAEGKEKAKETYAVKDSAAPDLKPDLSALVVLPLPLRSRESVMEKLELHPEQSLFHDLNGCHLYLEPEPALELLAALLATERGDEAREVYRSCFADRDDRRVGFFPLLAACGVDPYGEPSFRRALAEDGKNPLLRYLALNDSRAYGFLQGALPMYQGDSVAGGGLFAKLATFHDLYRRWQSQNRAGWRLPIRPDEERRTWEFVKAERRSPLGWALLGYVQDHGGRHGETRWRDLAQTWEALAGDEERSPARYEQARCLMHGGRRAEGRDLFQKLYARVLKEGGLPLIDGDFREALLGEKKEEDLWGPLMRRTAAALVKDRRRAAAATLAWQCRQLGDNALAENVLALALRGVGDEERLTATLAAVDYLKQTNQTDRAQELVHGLLKRKEHAGDPDLWRLASRLAERRGQDDQELAALERALDLEYPHLPAVIELEPWRRDHRRLLGHYRRLAETAAELKAAPPADLLARTVRAADRWRAHDPETREACTAAAAVLRALGARSLAWDYESTAASLRAGDGDVLAALAARLAQQGHYEEADEAFRVAVAAEPDNADLLWERAQTLRQAGRADEARGVLRRLAQGAWPERYRGVQDRARWDLEQK
jgi:predicted Zn-dependent protease